MSNILVSLDQRSRNMFGNCPCGEPYRPAYYKPYASKGTKSAPKWYYCPGCETMHLREVVQ